MGQYQSLCPPNRLLTKAAALRIHGVCALTKNWAMMAGKVRMDWAKMTGIMPAIFTCSGRLPRTGMLCRLPMRRPGYITGTLRRPCWTNTIASTVRTTMTTKAVRATTRVCSSAMISSRLAGMRETMPAKMISDRPWLRMPYSEISSPSQMANIVPPVMVMIMVMVGKFRPRSLPKVRIGTVVLPLSDRINRICPKAFSAAMGTAR